MENNENSAHNANSSNNENSENLKHKIRNTAPPRLSRTEIRTLLWDSGRQSLHTLISDAVDALGAVRQLKRQVIFEDREEILGSGLEDSWSLRNEVSHTAQLWKLRLDILEMIAEAQGSLRHLPRSRKKEM